MLRAELPVHRNSTLYLRSVIMALLLRATYSALVMHTADAGHSDLNSPL